MEFRILGPLEVLDEGRALTLGGAKQRGLLAVLLLHANEVVSSDRLIDELWGEHVPTTAAKTIQVYVSHLRKAIGPGVLVTRAPGYLLRLDPAQLDLHRFEALLREARATRPDTASDKLREALALWRGPALADFSYEPFAQADIARLEELRRVALEERIEADLALGRHADLVGELEALVAEHPLRERLRGQLLVALYRCGRQAEALAAYQDARRALVEELGIEPERSLRELERAILRQDPALDLPEVTRAGKRESSVRGVFVGRERELAELLDGLDDALAGHGRLFLLSGEPGIGKSRLADELAHDAKHRGAHVLVGRSWEAGGAPAFWPWVQAIRAYLRERAPEVLRAQLGPGASDLAQMLPEIRELLPDLPELPSLEPEGARFRLFDAAASFLTNAARAQPLVLILDDLHAADTPSLLLLQFVAGELAEARILILGAFRDVDPTLKEPLSATLAELNREPVTRPLPLTGLGEADVASFIEVSAGVEPPERLVGAIHRETEGNPLFVGEVVRLLAAEGRLEELGAETSVKLSIPHGVRAVIGRRMRGLSEECKRVLVLASVLGREFGLDALERVSGVSGDELLELLDQAIAERVVSEVPGAPGRLRFAHALIRETLYDELTAGARLRLHRRIGEALEALYAANPEPHLAELAHHFFEAAPGGDIIEAIGYARRAGDRAVSFLAYEEAVRLYQIGLQALELKTSPDEETHCELLLALGDAQTRAGDESGAKQTFLQAVAVARALAEPELLARTALGYGGRFSWARAGRDTYLVPLLEEALVALGDEDSALRVRVMTRLAGALRDQHAREPRAALSEGAVEMARRIADPAALAYALDGRFTAIYWPENTEERLAIATELIELAEEIGDAERAPMAHYERMMTRLELGDIPGVNAELERIALLTEELRQPAQLWLLVVTRATLALFQGRLEEAEQMIPRALALGQRAQSSDAVLSYRIQLFTLRTQRGEPQDLEELLKQSLDDYPARPMFRCMLAWLYVELGRESEAREIFEDLAADDFAALPLTNEWLFSMGFLADVAERLGGVDGAQTMYELLLPYAARNACTADYIATGSVSRSLGILASILSRWEEAERHFEDALEMNERMGAWPWAARTQLAHARMLLARGASADRDAARELVSGAVETFRELGAEAEAARASARLEELRGAPAR